ncbi:MAG TPA: hypothetical protein VER12_18240, partial [Polyangiaceae bacterium]|nr:hypothetical protein [Polyangiaceae bacterium]
EPLVPEPLVPEPLVPEPLVPEPLVPEPLVPEPLVPEPLAPPVFGLVAESAEVELQARPLPDARSSAATPTLRRQ